MQIDRIYYPVETLGFGKRIGIWTVGCPRKCYNCSNPELQETNAGKDISIVEVIDIISKYVNVADGITITGGEPFKQFEELKILLEEIAHLGFDDVLVYTGYTIGELINLGYEAAFRNIGILIDGEYIDNLNDNVGIRGSSNQKVHILKPELEEIYNQLSRKKRQIQTVNCDGKLYGIGIPISNKNR
ncbi:MAG: 4Fe-4S single cluster domain-containing protein [Oscillospiraceae bacterium]